jgi:hypothetical protein
VQFRKLLVDSGCLPRISGGDRDGEVSEALSISQRSVGIAIEEYWREAIRGCLVEPTL